MHVYKLIYSTIPSYTGPITIFDRYIIVSYLSLCPLSSNSKECFLCNKDYRMERRVMNHSVLCIIGVNERGLAN